MSERDRYRGKNSSKFMKMRELSKKRKIKHPLNESMNDSLNETIRGLEILWSEQKKNKSVHGNLDSQRKSQAQATYSSNTKIPRAQEVNKENKIRKRSIQKNSPPVKDTIDKLDIISAKINDFCNDEKQKELKPIYSPKGKKRSPQRRSHFEKSSKDKLSSFFNKNSKNSTLRRKKVKKVLEDPDISLFDQYTNSLSRTNFMDHSNNNNLKYSLRHQQKKQNSLSLKNRILNMKNREKETPIAARNSPGMKHKRDKNSKRSRKNSKAMNFNKSETYHGYAQKLSQRSKQGLYSPFTRERKPSRVRVNHEKRPKARSRTKDKDKNHKRMTVLNCNFIIIFSEAKLERLKKQVKKLTDNFEVVKCDMENINFDKNVRVSNQKFDENIKHLMKMVQEAIEHQQSLINSSKKYKQ